MPKILATEQDFWDLVFLIFYLFLVILLVFYLKATDRLISNIKGFDYFILVASAFRLIRLFTYDSITAFIRRYLGHFEKGPKKTLHNLINCPWCTGVWMALVVLYTYFIIPYSWPFLLLLSIAGMASIAQIIVWKIGKE